MLDLNLFSLTVKATAQQQLELSESEHVGRYTVISQDRDSLALLDSLTASPLGSCKRLNGKVKLCELCNPTAAIELKSTSTMSWEWTFLYEEETFFWKRDKNLDGSLKGFTLWLSRKPEADWNCVLYVAPNRRNASAVIQFLDYNLNRLDIKDRLGLEVITLLSLCSFLDVGSGEEARPSQHRQSSHEAIAPPRKEPTPESRPAPTNMRTPPVHDIPLGEQNEVFVLDNLPEKFLVEHCRELLKDQQMSYIVLKAKTQQASVKALKVASEVKRQATKHNEELHQYVRDESKLAISTDKSAYQAASSISIYLSRVEMSELNPTAPLKAKSPLRPSKTKLVKR